MSRTLYLGGLAYSLGTTRGIEHVAELAADAGRLQQFHDMGLREYSEIAPSDLEHLATDTVNRSLDEAEIHPDDLEVVVLTSSTIWNDAQRILKCLASQVGLGSAYPYGVTLSECANATAAIKLAGATLSDSPDACALVLVADCIHLPRSRLVIPDASIYSDSVASFIVSRAEIENGFAIEQIFTMADWRVAQADPAGSEYLSLVMKNLRASCRALARTQDDLFADIDLVCANNYSDAFTELVGLSCGVPTERIYTANLPRFAHAYAADTLINLADYLDRAPLAVGARVAMLSSGIGTWSSLLLRRTAP